MLKNKELYFKDSFFSTGRTEIFNSSKERVGEIDLKSSFSSSIDVLNKDGSLLITGKFTFFSNQWRIYNSNEKELGVLKQKISFLGKNFEYTSNGRGVFHIKSEPFSREYRILDKQEKLIAKFDKVSGFFSASAFQLMNFSDEIMVEELIAVVMGVNEIYKRNSG